MTRPPIVRHGDWRVLLPMPADRRRPYIRHVRVAYRRLRQECGLSREDSRDMIDDLLQVGRFTQVRNVAEVTP